MSEMYIEQKISETKTYSDFTDVVSNNRYDTKICIENADVISSMLMHYNPDLHCAVLNHMCYRKAAEGFANGERQGREEELCSHSDLYPILLGNKGFFDYFKDKKHNHVHRGLYESRIMYIPHLKFDRDNNYCEYSVIGAQAPNWKSMGIRYHKITAEENYNALEERIDMIFNVAAVNNVDVFILGNFGCNVYGQNPAEVAGMFKKFLETKYKGCFKEIYIPMEDPKHLDAFRDVFA